jgi:cold shock CspA family protein
MGRSQESFHKKEVKRKKEKKRKDKEKKLLERRENPKASSFDDMIAYVDENGNITDTPPDRSGSTSPEAEEIEVSVPKKDPSESNKIKSGRLTFYNDTKGYGFITEEGTGQSIFVHVNEFKDDIFKGDRVNFEIGKGDRGPSAFNVSLDK